VQIYNDNLRNPPIVASPNQPAESIGARVRPRPRPAPPPAPSVDDLADYADQCEKATGISIPPAFSCLGGEEVPGQKFTPTQLHPRGPCIAPNVLNGKCDPGSRFQILRQTNDAVVVAHCRKVGWPQAGDQWGDIAIIQYNKANGAICFYQALGHKNTEPSLPGSNIPSPSKRNPPNSSEPDPNLSGFVWGDSRRHWFTPKATEAIGCAGCHDNGGLVRSPYIMGTFQMRELQKKGYDNQGIPLHYVGDAFKHNRSWSIETTQDPTDNGAGNCTDCHRLAVSNHKEVVAGVRDPKKWQLGSAWAFAVTATAATQKNKLDHSLISPIWMRPLPTIRQPVLADAIYHAGAEATAKRFKECARQFIDNNFDIRIRIRDCKFTLLGTPVTAPSPSPTPPRLPGPKRMD